MQRICGPDSVTNFYARRVAARSFLLLGHSRVNFAVGQAGGNLVAKVEAAHVFQQVALGIEYEGISTLQNGQRRQRLQSSLQTLAANSMLKHDVAHYRYQRGGSTVYFFAHAG